MKQLILILVIVGILWLSGCCSIPDAPGPIGIPGI